MKITILGSGTLFPTKKRFSSSFLMEFNNSRILIDCGHCALARLAEMEIDPRTIDLMFISHFHTDHFGDAFNLIHTRAVGDIYEHNKDPMPLTVIGPASIEERFRKWRTIFWAEPDENCPINFKEGEIRHRLNDLLIETYPVKHVPWFDSIGLRISMNEKTFVYPGDIGGQNDFDYLAEKFSGADVLFIESGYNKPTPNHYYLNRLEELMERAKIKKAYIVHIKHLPEEEKRVAEFAKKAKQDIIIAEDKQVLEI